MKVLVLELEEAGCGLGFALRCVKAGHQVRYWTKGKENERVGEGFPGLERLRGSFLPSAKWADVVVPTGNAQFVAQLDALRAAGVRVFGASKKSTALEIDRGKGQAFLAKHGIDVPPFKTFRTLKEAEAHQRKHDERFVFKTLGDEADKSLSYVGKTPADMVARLQRWQRLGMNPRGEVMLQTVIEGVEFGVSRWMGSDGFIGPYNENFEHKKLLSGNCGPNCGEAGTIQKYAHKSQLGEMVLEPLEDALVGLGHMGDIDVNCIVDSHGKPWPLEFTSRLGWPAFNIMCAAHQGDPVEWMKDAVEGKDTLKVSTAIACGIVVAQPDYPYSKFTHAETLDIPIYGVTDRNKRFLWPQSVKMATLPQMKDGKVVEEPMWATCGDYLLVATGLGKSVKQSAAKAYRVVKELEIPNMIYRDDVGEKLQKELPQLQEHGFAEEFTYEG